MWIDSGASGECGRGNVFLVCVFVSVWAATFEAVDIESSFLVWWYILTIKSKSFDHCQGDILKNTYLAKWTSV